MQLSAVSIVVAAALLAVCTARAEPAQGTEGTERRPVVVFFAPDDLAPELKTALEDALNTQLSLLPASVRYESSPMAAAAREPVERLLVAKQLADQHEAVAIYWLELPASGPWLLYAVDARAERMIMRPLSAHGQSPEADVETLALIVRATTEALLHGESLPAVAAPSEPAPKPSAAAPHDDEPVSQAAGLRISGAYAGTTFAKQRRWQHGFALRAAWLWTGGQYFGLGFTFVPALRFSDPAARFDVDRYPISIHGGLRLLAAGPFSISGELGAELELRNRRTLSVAPGYVAADDQVKVLFNVTPRVEAQLALTSWLMTFASVGTDLVVGNFAYTIRSGDSGKRRYLLEPNWMRLTIQVGVGIMR